MDRIVESAIKQMIVASLEKILIEHPEIITIGFYKDARAAGIYLHRRYQRYP